METEILLNLGIYGRHNAIIRDGKVIINGRNNLIWYFNENDPSLVLDGKNSFYKDIVGLDKKLKVLKPEN